jgi:hypothetical protein
MTKLLSFIGIVTSMILLTISPTRAQDATNAGLFSVIVSIGHEIPVSPSMRATFQDFKSDVMFDATPRNYPFGDDRTESISFGGQVAYRLPATPISAVIGLRQTRFLTTVEDNSSEEARLTITTLTFGGEYAYGEPSDMLNLYGRLGANFNWMNGRAIVNYFVPIERPINEAIRFGGEVEVGGRVNIPTLPVSIDIGVNYTNANLLGKEFTPSSIGEAPTELNDGKNSDDPEDQPRAIDFVSLRGGIRVWL